MEKEPKLIDKIIEKELQKCIFCGKKLSRTERNNPGFYGNKTFDQLIGRYSCCNDCDTNIVTKARHYLMDKEKGNL